MSPEEKRINEWMDRRQLSWLERERRRWDLYPETLGIPTAPIKPSRYGYSGAGASHPRYA